MTVRCANRHCFAPNNFYLAHGAKDLWQHRSQFVRGTRWWPPFCFAVDMAVAAAVAVQILLAAQFHA